ncbi:MAG TPA: hypothetical protein VKD69_04115 [Vicinamibacterales bacterium]|nr:hypothetical protein [Vicinamibacterales bacterium]
MKILALVALAALASTPAAALTPAAQTAAPAAKTATPPAKPDAAKAATPQQPPAQQPPAKPQTQAEKPEPAKPGLTPAAVPAATAGESKPAAPAAAAQPAPEAYSYRPEGRRDPFLNLTGRGANAGVMSRKGEGAAGLAVSDISVRGVMQSRGTLVAMIMGPDNKTYIVHQGDKLLDGTIKTLTPQGLVIVQEVNDPLSLIKQREVRKLLRSLEDAKE